MHISIHDWWSRLRMMLWIRVGLNTMCSTAVKGISLIMQHSELILSLRTESFRYSFPIFSLYLEVSWRSSTSAHLLRTVSPPAFLKALYSFQLHLFSTLSFLWWQSISCSSNKLRGLLELLLEPFMKGVTSVSTFNTQWSIKSYNLLFSPPSC